jgi:hypothetical protein
MKMSSLIVILFAVFFALPTAGQASRETLTKTRHCFPRGIPDSDGQRAYMRNTLGGIDSIDLKTGKLLWTSAAASIPLLLNRHYLLASKYISENVIQVVKIDCKTGELVTTSEPINFPEGIKISSNRDQDFGLEARMANDTLKLVWQGRTRYEGGAPPPTYLRQKWQKQLSGIFEIDLVTGNVTSQITDNVTTSLEAPRSPLTSTDCVNWKIEDQIVTLSSKMEPQGQTFFIKPADAKQFTRLLSGSNLIADITEDGLYVLIRSKDSSPAIWHLFSAETGREIGTVPYEIGAQQPCVMDDRLFYLGPQVDNDAKHRAIALKAVDLRSGRVLWSRELKETDAAPRPLPPAVSPGSIRQKGEINFEHPSPMSNRNERVSHPEKMIY